MTNTDKSQWVDVRRSVLVEYYDLPDTVQATVDNLFSRMEALAAECKDQGEFETRLAASPLAAEYNNLFASIGQYVRKDAAFEAELAKEKAAADRQNRIDNVKNQVRSRVLQQLNTHVPLGDYSWGEPWYYAIPIIGPILKRFS